MHPEQWNEMQWDAFVEGSQRVHRWEQGEAVAEIIQGIQSPWQSPGAWNPAVDRWMRHNGTPAETVVAWAMMFESWMTVDMGVKLLQKIKRSRHEQSSSKFFQGKGKSAMNRGQADDSGLRDLCIRLEHKVLQSTVQEAVKENVKNESGGSDSSRETRVKRL